MRKTRRVVAATWPTAPSSPTATATAKHGPALSPSSSPPPPPQQQQPQQQLGRVTRASVAASEAALRESVRVAVRPSLGALSVLGDAVRRHCLDHLHSFDLARLYLLSRAWRADIETHLAHTSLLALHLTPPRTKAMVALAASTPGKVLTVSSALSTTATEAQQVERRKTVVRLALRLATHGCRRLRKLVTNGWSAAGGVALATVVANSRATLRSVECRVTPEVLAALTACPQLESASVWNTMYTDMDTHLYRALVVDVFASCRRLVECVLIPAPPAPPYRVHVDAATTRHLLASGQCFPCSFFP
jgi:hypothetical protein